MGESLNVYAQVYKSGVTDAAGQGSNVQVWIGYSTSDTNPNTWTNWIPASYGSDQGNNDEYFVDLGANMNAAGTYYYASRIQLGTALYVYGGYKGGFWDGSTNISGTLTVNPAEQLDWVNLQSPATGNITYTQTIDVYAQVYESGLTEAAGQGANVTAEIGYSTTNTNPNTWTNWVPATFNVQSGNNDEYKATLSGLPIGTYYFASRFKYGLADYVYGGYSSSPNGGFWDGTTNVSGVLIVSPVTVKWDGGAGTTAWSDALNWSGDIVPASTDMVVLDNSNVAGTYSVVLPSETVKTTINKLIITPTLPNTITLTLPAANTYGASGDGGLVVGDNTSSTDDIIINEGGVLINASGATVGNGIQVSSTSNGTLRINNGGKFIHNTARAAGGTAPLLSTAPGTEKGIYEYDVPGSTSSFGISASDRTYGSLILTKSSGTASYTSSGIKPLTIKNDFILNTGVTYSTSMSGALNIAGNFTNNGVALTIPASQAVNFNGTSAQLISGTSGITLAGAVTIASGSTVNLAPSFSLTVSGSSLTNNGTLTLKSDATGTATLLNPATLSGTGTYSFEQYLNAARNWYVSSPVDGVAAPTGYTYYQYNEAATTFDAAWVSSGSTLTAGTGYIAQASGASTFAVSGASFTNADKTLSLIRTTGSYKPGFNLVANPYPSFLNIEDLKNNTDIEPTYWIRSQNSGYVFDTYNITGATGTSLSGKAVTKYIPSMQAFWLRVASGKAGASVALLNANRGHQDVANNAFRAPSVVAQNQVLRLTATNGINKDEALIYTNAAAADSYDRYDSPKFMYDKADIQIFTLLNNEPIVINGMNAIPYDTEIALGYTAKAGNYTISANEFTNFPGDYSVYLKDNGVLTDLTAGAYSFVLATDGSSNNRFSVIIRSKVPTAVENAEKAGVSIYASHSAIKVTVNSELKENGTVCVYNSVGQQLAAQKLTSNTTTLNGNFKQGVYVVKVLNGTTVTATQKVVIN